MNIFLALPLLLNVPEAPSNAGDEAGALMSFEIRAIDCGGLGWRSRFQPRLSFSGYERGQAAWIAPSGTIDAIVGHFRDDDGSVLVALPELNANEGTATVVDSWTSHHKVIHAERVVAGGVEAAPARPIVAPVEDGTHLEVVGHRDIDGVRLSVEIAESRLTKVHLVETSPELADGPDQAVCGTYTVQVPEVYNAEIHGEWSIPDGSGLILSLGIRSSVEGEAALVRERLILITPRATRVGAMPDVDLALTRASARRTAPRVMPAADGPSSVPATSGEGRPVVALRSIPVAPWFILPLSPTEVRPIRDLPIAEMPKGMVPSRSLPPAVTPEGDTVEPVVDDEAAERTDYQSFVDGRPVPTPQVTTIEPGASAASGAEVDPKIQPASNEATVEAAPAVTRRIAIYFNYATGFSIRIERLEPADLMQAAEGEPETRR